MAGTEAVTLAGSRHLPADEFGTRARSREHEASQAQEKRRNRAFLGSQAGGLLLHAVSQAEGMPRLPNKCKLHPVSLVGWDAGYQTRP